MADGRLPGSPTSYLGPTAVPTGGSGGTPCDNTPQDVDNALVTPGTSDEFSRCDHVHGLVLSDDNPQPDGTAAPGIDVYPSRSDHVHPITPGLAWTFDLFTSYGHGTPGVDDVLPGSDGDVAPFWFSPTLDFAHATIGQVREWPVVDPMSTLALIVRVDAANLTDDGAQLIVTVDGVDTVVAVDIPAGLSSDYTLSAQAAVAVAATSKIGVRFAPGVALHDTSTLRCEARLRALWDGTAPPALAGSLWVKATDVTLGTGTDVIGMTDLDPLSQDLDTVDGMVTPPQLVDDAGIPGVLFGDPTDSLRNNPVYRTSNLRYTLVDEYTTDIARTLYYVMRPFDWNHGVSSGTGGMLSQFRAVNGTVMQALAYNWNNSGDFKSYNNAGGVTVDGATIGSYTGVRCIIKVTYDSTGNWRMYRYISTGVGTGTWTLIASGAADPADNSVSSGYFLGGSNGGSGGGPKGEMILNEHRVFKDVQPFGNAYEQSLISTYFP